MILKNDIVSSKHGRLYAIKGSEIIILHDHGNVKIVEEVNDPGNVFPVSSDEIDYLHEAVKLTDLNEPNKKIKPITDPKPKKNFTINTKKSQQQNLF